MVSLFKIIKLIASPVGLRTLSGEEEAKPQYDFLSSIEIVLLDSAHLFLYQNMDHLEEVLKSVNQLPTKPESLNDINRIMNLFLDKKAAFLRQTIILTKHLSLDLSYLLRNCAQNYIGRSIVPYEYNCGLPKELTSDSKELYLRKIPVGDYETASEKKFDYFIKKVWPNLSEIVKDFTIICVPSYFDFVRLKKYFK